MSSRAQKSARTSGASAVGPSVHDLCRFPSGVQSALAAADPDSLSCRVHASGWACAAIAGERKAFVWNIFADERELIYFSADSADRICLVLVNERTTAAPALLYVLAAHENGAVDVRTAFFTNDFDEVQLALPLAAGGERVSIVTHCITVASRTAPVAIACGTTAGRIALVRCAPELQLSYAMLAPPPVGGNGLLSGLVGFAKKFVGGIVNMADSTAVVKLHQTEMHLIVLSHTMLHVWLLSSRAAPRHLASHALVDGARTLLHSALPNRAAQHVAFHDLVLDTNGALYLLAAVAFTDAPHAPDLVLLHAECAGGDAARTPNFRSVAVMAHSATSVGACDANARASIVLHEAWQQQRSHGSFSTGGGRRDNEDGAQSSRPARLATGGASDVALVQVCRPIARGHDAHSLILLAPRASRSGDSETIVWTQVPLALRGASHVLAHSALADDSDAVSRALLLTIGGGAVELTIPHAPAAVPAAATSSSSSSAISAPTTTGNLTVATDTATASAPTWIAPPLPPARPHPHHRHFHRFTAAEVALPALLCATPHAPATLVRTALLHYAHHGRIDTSPAALAALLGALCRDATATSSSNSQSLPTVADSAAAAATASVATPATASACSVAARELDALVACIGDAAPLLERELLSSDGSSTGGAGGSGGDGGSEEIVRACRHTQTELRVKQKQLDTVFAFGCNLLALICQQLPPLSPQSADTTDTAHAALHQSQNQCTLDRLTLAFHSACTSLAQRLHTIAEMCSFLHAELTASQPPPSGMHPHSDHHAHQQQHHSLATGARGTFERRWTVQSVVERVCAHVLDGGELSASVSASSSSSLSSAAFAALAPPETDAAEQALRAQGVADLCIVLMRASRIARVAVALAALVRADADTFLPTSALASASAAAALSFTGKSPYSKSPAARSPAASSLTSALVSDEEAQFQITAVLHYQCAAHILLIAVNAFAAAPPSLVGQFDTSALRASAGNDQDAAERKEDVGDNESKSEHDSASASVASAASAAADADAAAATVWHWSRAPHDAPLWHALYALVACGADARTGALQFTRAAHCHRELRAAVFHTFLALVQSLPARPAHLARAHARQVTAAAHTAAAALLDAALVQPPQSQQQPAHDAAHAAPVVVLDRLGPAWQTLAQACERLDYWPGVARLCEQLRAPAHQQPHQLADAGGASAPTPSNAMSAKVRLFTTPAGGAAAPSVFFATPSVAGAASASSSSTSASTLAAHAHHSSSDSNIVASAASISASTAPPPAYVERVAHYARVDATMHGSAERARGFTTALFDTYKRRAVATAAANIELLRLPEHVPHLSDHLLAYLRATRDDQLLWLHSIRANALSERDVVQPLQPSQQHQPPQKQQAHAKSVGDILSGFQKLAKLALPADERK